MQWRQTLANRTLALQMPGGRQLFVTTGGAVWTQQRSSGVCYRTRRSMMEVMVTTAIRCAKLQSSRHHQQTNTQLFTGRMPFLSPNQQCQSTEGKTSKRRHNKNAPTLASCSFAKHRLTSTIFVKLHQLIFVKPIQLSCTRFICF